MSKEIINSLILRFLRTTGQLEQLEQLGRPAAPAALPMNLLEKVGHFISKRGDYIQEQISGKRVFSAHVTNATDEAGIAIGAPYSSLVDFSDSKLR